MVLACTVFAAKSISSMRCSDFSTTAPQESISAKLALAP